MDPINFIKVVSPAEQQALYRWYRISILFCSLFLCVIFIMQAMQLRQLYTLRKQIQETQHVHTHVQQLLQQQASLKSTYEALTKKVDTITTTTDQLKKTAVQLKTIKDLLSCWGTIETCSLTQKTLNLTLQCPSAHLANKIVKALNATPYFCALKLVSLAQHPSAKKYSAHITGAIK